MNKRIAYKISQRETNSCKGLHTQQQIHQADKIIALLREAGYKNIEDHLDLAKLPRYVTACYVDAQH